MNVKLCLLNQEPEMDFLFIVVILLIVFIFLAAIFYINKSSIKLIVKYYPLLFELCKISGPHLSEKRVEGPYFLTNYYVYFIFLYLYTKAYIPNIPSFVNLLSFPIRMKINLQRRSAGLSIGACNTSVAIDTIAIYWSEASIYMLGGHL